MPSTEATGQTSDHPPREERRPASLAGWLVHTGQTEAHDFYIDNLSYGGCRLQTAAKLAKGDAVLLTVHRRGAIPACVRWHNGSGVGLSFTTEPSDKVEKPRKVERLPLQAELVVRQSGRRPQLIDVSDLSRHGCCLSFVDLPAVGEWVWVALPGLAPVEARVRWTEGHRAGVEFVHPIPQAVFELLLLRWGLGN